MEHYKNLSLEDLFYINDEGLVCCEEWKDVTGYEGGYLISNLGRVKSLDRYVNSKIVKRLVKNRILKQTVNNRGYNLIFISLFGISKSIRVHRLVAIAFIINTENKPQVNHINGIRNDNDVKNLEWCTSSENMIHAYKEGLQLPVTGVNNGHSKLTESQVLEIRASDLRQCELVKKYNMSPMAISDIIRRRNWKHL